MARIYILSGPELGRTFEVKEGATIGRAVEAAVQLRDASVSRHHARLELREGTWRIVDAGSRNGVTLRGERVTDAALADGEEFQVGDVLLRFRATVPVPEAEAAEIEVEKGAEEPLDEITLEEDPVSALPSLSPPGSPSPAAPAAPAAPARPAAGARVARSLKTPAAPAATPLERTVANVQRTMQTEDRGKKVLQYNRIPDREGFFGSDLAQYPLWIKLGAVVLALLVSAAIFLIAFKGTSFLKSKTIAPTAESPADGTGSNP